MLSEGGMDEEFETVRINVELRADVSGVADEVPALGGFDPAFYEEVVELFRAPEDPDTLAIL